MSKTLESPIGKRFCKIIERIIEMSKKANERGVTEGIPYFISEAEKQEFSIAWKMINKEMLASAMKYINAFGEKEGLEMMPKTLREWFIDLKKLSEEYEANGEI